MSVFIHNVLLVESEKEVTFIINVVLGILYPVQRFFRLLLADFEVVE